MATILYAGAIGLMLGLRGGLTSILCGAWAIMAVAMAAYLSAPVDLHVLLGQAALALASFNAFLMVSLYARYKLATQTASTN